MLHRPPPEERGALVGRVSGGGFPARREADGPRRGREGACGCGGLAGPPEGFTPTPEPASFGASRNQTDPGLPTESSLHLGLRFPAPPPQLWASLVAQIVKNPPARQETWVRFLGRKIPWRRKLQPTPVFLPRKSSGQRILAGHWVPKCRRLLRY